jgi:hypothetical protein
MSRAFVKEIEPEIDGLPDRPVVETYKFRAYGDYQPWPGPNSNPFVQAALDAVTRDAAAAGIDIVNNARSSSRSEQTGYYLRPTVGVAIQTAGSPFSIFEILADPLLAPTV